MIETLFREGITETAIAKQNKVTNNKWKWFILTLYLIDLFIDIESTTKAINRLNLGKQSIKQGNQQQDN